MPASRRPLLQQPAPTSPQPRFVENLPTSTRLRETLRLVGDFEVALHIGVVLADEVVAACLHITQGYGDRFAGVGVLVYPGPLRREAVLGIVFIGEFDGVSYSCAEVGGREGKVGSR